MKEYYIYDSELRELKRTGAIATVLFAAGSACAGFALNVQLGVSFAENLAPQIKAEWISYRNTAFILALVFYVFGILQSLTGYNQVEQIKAQTLHGTQRYEAKPWYKVALWGIVFLVFLALGFLARAMFW